MTGQYAPAAAMGGLGLGCTVVCVVGALVAASTGHPDAAGGFLRGAVALGFITVTLTVGLVAFIRWAERPGASTSRPGRRSTAERPAADRARRLRTRVDSGVRFSKESR